METKKLSAALFLCLMAAVFYACSDDTEETLKPITLEYDDPAILFDNERRAFSLTPFSEPTRPLYIRGGDGHYTITNSREDIVRVNYNGETIRFQPVDTGTASIRIEDASDQSYVLTIRVNYRTTTHPVLQKKYIVQGDGLTLGEKSRLEQEIIAADSVEKYVFTFTDKENSVGTVRLYTQKSGNEADYMEYGFENETINSSGEIATDGPEKSRPASYNRLTIKTEKGNIILYVTQDFSFLRNTKMTVPSPIRYCFTEVLTEKYKKAYPAAEQIYKVHLVSLTN